MLKGIDPLLTPDLLRALAAMGHNEWVAIVDANFTGERLAQTSTFIRLPGIDLVRATQAVLSVLPLANDVPAPVAYMHHCGQSPDFQTPVQKAAVGVAVNNGLSTSAAPLTIDTAPDLSIAGAPATGTRAQAIERFAFYQQMSRVSVLIQTGEMSAYGNVLLCKGLIKPH
jgi:L-fucose mutarotase